MNSKPSTLPTLLGTASLVTLASALAARAGEAQLTQVVPIEIPEQVLITGSLIRGTAAVGVPVTNLSPQDFTETGALTTADLFRTVPQANVIPGPVATNPLNNIERGTRVNIRGLDTGDATRSLLMIDGLRFPPQGNGNCIIDPSIIPQLAIERIDVLVDGASATYGSDALAGVINIILKRNYDGAITQLRYSNAPGGKNRYQASQLWGRTWDGGGITIAYEWYDDSPVPANTKTSKFTLDYTPWGLDDKTPLTSSIPGTISIGAPATTFPGGFPANVGSNCTNCFAVPRGAGANFSPINGGIGPLLPFSASTLNWTSFNVPANTGTNGTRNVFNPYDLAWFDAAQQRNAIVLTFDQRLTRNITLYGAGFYSNRRAQLLNTASANPNLSSSIFAQVPTWNPYYPTGGAPANLRVSYNISLEKPSPTSAYELANRYHFGFRIDLPGEWAADIYHAGTYDNNFNSTRPLNKRAISAALGWTMPASAAIGTTPGIATWTKPATVPYLNLFCDPTVYQCNAPETLGYLTGIRQLDQRYWVKEHGARFDGPLFDLPGGEVKAAVGAVYNSYSFRLQRFDNTGQPSLVVPFLNDPNHRQVWAVFAQVNVPIIGDDNALPFIRRLELEGSWRHDQYSDVRGTSNPKLAFNWMVSEDFGLTIRGAWGTSFRAPGFGEVSPFANAVTAGWNLGTLFQNPTTITLNCDAPPGSVAYRLMNPPSGPAFACGPSVRPGGIHWLGSSAGPVRSGWRDLVNTDQRILEPEKSTNWALGAEFAPLGFLQGLDIQATWYQIKITDLLRNFGQPDTSSFNEAARGFVYVIPTDLIGIDPNCNNNMTPSTCPPFQEMVVRMLSNPINIVPLEAQTSLIWIQDGGTMNRGWDKMSGIDWTMSYDWDMGRFGAGNVGWLGTYYLYRKSQTFPSEPILDGFHTTINSIGGIAQEGVETLPRFRYRARLGWANGPWSVTAFMDYQSHFYHTREAPPNVNFQCVAAGSTLPGGTFPCLINNYTNIQPPVYTFDLSVGFDTGDAPANEYLRNIGIQLVVQNLFDRDPSFQYKPTNAAGAATAFNPLESYQGRTISLILTKTW